MISLYDSVGYDIIAAKLHINKGIRSHLELIFMSKEKLKYFATKYIEIFNRTYYEYIPTDTKRSFLLVKIRNVSLGDKKIISDEMLDGRGD